MTRRPTNITLPEPLFVAARELGINISQTCERALANEISAARRAAWLRDNRAAMDEWNAHVDANGLPLAAHGRPRQVLPPTLSNAKYLDVGVSPTGTCGTVVESQEPGCQSSWTRRRWVCLSLPEGADTC